MGGALPLEAMCDPCDVCRRIVVLRRASAHKGALRGPMIHVSGFPALQFTPRPIGGATIGATRVRNDHGLHRGRGGIGRHTGLKILSSKERVGSSPTVRTSPSFRPSGRCVRHLFVARENAGFGACICTRSSRPLPPNVRSAKGQERTLVGDELTVRTYRSHSRLIAA